VVTGLGSVVFAFAKHYLTEQTAEIKKKDEEIKTDNRRVDYYKSLFVFALKKARSYKNI